MSGSEEKKLNSLHEEDSLYKAQGGKAVRSYGFPWEFRK